MTQSPSKPIHRQPLTTPDGPVITSAKTLRALAAIRREKLLADAFGRVLIARSNWREVAAAWPAGAGPYGAPLAAWLEVRDDHPEQSIPERVASATPSEAATLRLALASRASLVLLDGPIKEKAKLSYIKSEGTLSLLVGAYRAGRLNAVQPMVKALQALGHGDVLPNPEMLQALWAALDKMEEE